MNLNIKAKKDNTYDAIVVGSGITGGWAAKELTEKGLKTIMLERGRNVDHIEDYPTMFKEPWELPNNDRLTQEELQDYQKQNRTGYTVRQSTKHWWVKDTEHPYEEKKRFDWMRGYHVGGRSLMWGRQSYRLSNMDFEANAKDGHGVDWPIRYKDIEKWYDHVEKHIGVNGKKEGLPQLPDGQFLPPMEMNCIEELVRERIAKNYNDRIMTIGRSANLTQPHKGRGNCQYRNRCMRGCPYGAYFSTQSSTLPPAMATGNLTLRPHSIVTEVLYDPETQKATGVRILDAETLEYIEYHAKVVFLCASTLGSTWILMHSNEHFPDGMGNASGELGHNIMDHHLGAGASASYDGFKDKYYSGRRPNGIYVPRFRNIDSKHSDFIRGYGYQGGGSREGWSRNVAELSIGPNLKEEISKPGEWSFGFGGFGEILPYHENRAWLNYDKTDKFGLPTFVFDCEIKENEKAMRKDMAEQAGEMLERAGLKDVNVYNSEFSMGLGIHEMGTARMGRDPKTSVLNKWNQLHEVKNVFVTDGACMTSSGCQNPSLTYMALTARAADYAVEQLKKNNL
ncbi:GMC oxidoreductase [Gracilimonas mengyeensis]|uniref:Choline dehydrogenase n=1 Tax=Gracilimonas mengyeensis TaxID=1302730 RepID=A0A521EAI2_9BACT|nr:GMC family oxidoreductase [Gracilimonas mengyeensis]SMO80924.1 Choline dehydrogenase [Gracilimonas mengyeensis]